MTPSLKNWIAADAGNSVFYRWMHVGLGLIYLTAFIPLYFQIQTLIGSQGLLPAKELLSLSYHEQGIMASFMQFPSLFHFFPHNITFYLLVTAGCVGAVLLILNIQSFVGAILAWTAYLSITTIGSDFFVIIIDLFLSEVGFLSLFSTFFLQYKGAVPNAVDFCFRLLNFRLWFCMGINKFYLPKEVWTDFTFFNYFFQAQPMPTPLAPYFNSVHYLAKYLAEVLLFIGEIVVPFFVFGGKRWRQLAFLTFVLISVLIELAGNYGFFNVLSIVLALTILKHGDLRFTKPTDTTVQQRIKIGPLVKYVLATQVAFQLFYCVYVFDPKPFSPQNHFNYFFNNKTTGNKFVNVLLEPFRWVGTWRLCNPYGVFKGIPHYHGELRFSGSYDGHHWKYYEFRFLPSGLTDYLGFYAPVYPRLDHLMFYETISQGSFQFNPLNPYAKHIKPWVCTFIEKLLQNDEGVSRLLKLNPFLHEAPPKLIKAEAYRLQFAPLNNHKNWDAKPIGITRIYNLQTLPCTQMILTQEEALRVIF